MKRLLLLFLLFPVAAYSQSTPDAIPKTADPISKPADDPPLVVNEYTEVLLFNECMNSIAVSDGSLFNIGDTVLLIQMKGALMDSSNTASFGTIIDYKNAGNYEFNFISQKAGNQLTFKNRLTKNYDIPSGVVQLVRVPSYIRGNFYGLTCMAWDGTKGGILAIISRNSLSCGDDINVNGFGFRGGEGYNSVLPASNCFADNYSYSSLSQLAAFKGEGIASLSQNINKGRGSPAGGGGGGSSHNSGGGGGANAGAGGYGGYQTDTCGNAPFDNRGIGAKNFVYAATADKIFMGGGGGAGHADNTDFNTLPPSGGAGGGIVIIITDTLYMYHYKIQSNGINGRTCTSVDCNDGLGGGGAGGTILMDIGKIMDTVTIENFGGRGAYMQAPIVPGGKVGPGGGGGGGAFFMNTSSLPTNAALINNYGINGTVTNAGTAWGATGGTNGLSFFNLVLPFDTVLFKPNIDSVRINDSAVNCNSFNFQGLAFTNSNPIASWYWDFADGNTAPTQNAMHTYLTTGSFPVNLIATDIKGCKDSTSIIISPQNLQVDAGADKSFCSDMPISVMLNGTGTGSFSWSPAIYLNNAAQQTPVATIDTTTIFYLLVNGTGCSTSDSVKININRLPKVIASKSNDINCNLPFVKLNVSGALRYVWDPAMFLNNSSIENPVANPATTTNFIVTGTDSNGCTKKDSITVIADFAVGNVLLPNSFTPNGDGINDCFGIRYYRDVQNLTFIIYNRFGEKVFETKNAIECWDGNFKGQASNAGTYVYYLKAKTLCGDTVKKGAVLLIR